MRPSFPANFPLRFTDSFRSAASIAWLGFISLLATMNPSLSHAQKPIYDEAKVPTFKLPDPLVDFRGNPITTQSQWLQVRRPEIIEAFEQHVYGTMPDPKQHPVAIDAKVISDQVASFDVGSDDATLAPVQGRVREIQLKITRAGQEQTGSPEKPSSLEWNLLAITPAAKNGKVPVFLGYNFGGNATIIRNPKISLGKVWNGREKKFQTLEEKRRGSSSGRWPVGLMLSNGIGLVTVHYGDVDPDFHDEFKNGVHQLFPDLQNRPDNWASIGAWAWGAHRIMDYLTTDESVNEKKVILFGHSRLGKTALWAGACDERFAAVISNNSGCGGAALSRRRFGESVQRINKVFPHWFAARHRDYDANEDACPVDQHLLIAAIAPRPVYVASAVEDRWADPRGEFLSSAYASPVYQLFGKQGLVSAEQLDGTLELPNLEKPMGTDVRYHIRQGKHNVKRYDWQQFIVFANKTVCADED